MAEKQILSYKTRVRKIFAEKLNHFVSFEVKKLSQLFCTQEVTKPLNRKVRYLISIASHSSSYIFKKSVDNFSRAAAEIEIKISFHLYDQSHFGI